MCMMEITLAGLRVLREVAARGSFTAAAEALGYTQSSISRQVAGLEAAAGAQLFERATRGVRLTEAGRVLVRHGAHVLAPVDAAAHDLTALRELSTGKLTVGAFPTAITDLVPRALVAFSDRYPGVKVGLREGVTPVQLRMLRGGATDLAVISPDADFDDPQLTVDLLLEEPLLLAVSREHPLAMARSVDLDDLADCQWIIGKNEVGDPQLRLWQHVAWQPRSRFVVKDWTAKLGLIASNLGVGLVPGLAAASVRNDVALIAIRTPPGQAPATRKVVLATRSGTQDLPHIRAVTGLLHHAAADLTRDLAARLQDRW